MKKSVLVIFGVLFLICLGSFVSAIGLTPIARWDVVPYQRINAGETLNLGVVAFSKEGIDRVEFIISGQGYSGGMKTATEMSLNPQTGVWEYWVPLSASEFSSDGVINVEAVVYGRDGGVRTKDTHGGGEGLDALNLSVYPSGAQPKEIWVSVTGSDSNPGTRNSPVATVGKAMKIIEIANGGKADGGIVRLMPGNYSMNAGGYSSINTLNEWITITRDYSGTKENTIINRTGHYLERLPTTKLLKVSGVTIRGTREWVESIFYRSNLGWADNCYVIGYDWHEGLLAERETSPVQNAQYLTNCNITNTMWGADRALLARNLSIYHIGDDAIRQTPFVINSRVFDMQPGPDTCPNPSTNEECWHQDCWQWVGGSTLPDGSPWVPNNAILYGFRCDTQYNSSGNLPSFWVRQNRETTPLRPPAEGIAFVNNYIADIPGGIGWYVPGNHFLFWHNTFKGNFHFYNDFSLDGRVPLNILNFSVEGNVFQTLSFEAIIGDNIGGVPDAPGVSVFDWKNNHYMTYYVPIYSVWPGTGNTTGNPCLDSYGRPNSTSVLLNRVSPLVVPVDADGNPRDSMPDVGAYEFISETPPTGNCEIKKAYWRIL